MFCVHLQALHIDFLIKSRFYGFQHVVGYVDKTKKKFQMSLQSKMQPDSMNTFVKQK